MLYHKYGIDFSEFSHALTLIEHPAMESVFSASCNAIDRIGKRTAVNSR